MKKIIAAVCISALCSTIALQGTITHTFINDSMLPIQVSLRYYNSNYSDTKRIEPLTTYSFVINSGPTQIRGIDIRDADKNKFIMRPGVQNTLKKEYKGFQATKSTSWRFTINQDTKKGRLTLLEGGRYVPQKGAPYQCPTTDHNNCTVEGNLP